MQVASTPPPQNGLKWSLPKKEFHGTKPNPLLARVANNTAPRATGSSFRGRRQTLPPQFGKAQLKKAIDIVESDPLLEEGEEEKMPRRASFADISLKSTGKGSLLKNGGSLAKNTFLKSEPAFASVRLKKSVSATNIQTKNVRKTPAAAPKVEASKEQKTVKSLADKPIPNKEPETEVPKAQPSPKSKPTRTRSPVQVVVPIPPSTTPSEPPRLAVRRATYGGIALKSSPLSPIKKVRSRRATYASIELKKSAQGEAVKKGKDPSILIKQQIRFELPEEFIKKELRNSTTPIKPEVEILEEEKPDYKAVPLKSAFTPIKPEVETIPEEAPEYTAVQLKATEKVQKPKVQARRASYAEIQLVKSGHGEAIKNGGDVIKEDSVKSDEPLYTTDQLKKSGLGDTIKAGGTITKEQVHKPEPSYSMAQLKKSCHGEAIKNGGDVAKDESEKIPKNVLPEEFVKTELRKSTTPVKPEVEILEEEKPDYTAVQLKSATTPVKPEVETMPEQVPEYTAIQLKATEPASKPKVQSRRASYSEIQLAKSQHGDSIKSGGDVIKEDSIESTEPLYTPEQLKKSGFGDTIKSGGDVVKECHKTEPSYSPTQLKKSELGDAIKSGGSLVKKQEHKSEASYSAAQLKKSCHGDAIKNGGDVMKDESAKIHKNVLPEEFAAVQLRDTKDPIQPEVEILEEEKPDYTAIQLKDASTPVKAEVETLKEQAPEYTAVQLKATEPVKKPKASARRASYSDFQLAKSIHGEAIKSGGDVIKEDSIKSDESFYTPDQLKKSGVGDAIKHGGDVVKQQNVKAEPSYMSPQLKKSGLGQVIMSGGDVVKEGSEVSSEPSYSSAQLKKSGLGEVIKSGGDVTKNEIPKNILPKEFASVQLKDASNPMQPEVEVLEEEKPDYSAVILKSASTPVKPEVEILPEQSPDYTTVQLKDASSPVKPEVESLPEKAPEYTAVQLKAAKPAEKPNLRSRRASCPDIQLAKSSHGDTIKSGGDVIKEVDIKSSEPLYTTGQLKKSGLGDILKSGGNLVKERGHRVEPSYSPAQLKKSGLGEAIMEGGDVVKEGLDVPVEPAYTVTELKKSNLGEVIMGGGNVAKERSEEFKKNVLPDEFGEVQLKKPVSEFKPEIELAPSPVPEHTAVQLKAVEPADKEPFVRARRASYADLTLKKSSQGMAILNGGDVAKSSSAPRAPAFTPAQLKRIKGTLMAGGDATSEESMAMLPQTTAEKPTVMKRRATYAGVNLKSVGRFAS